MVHVRPVPKRKNVCTGHVLENGLMLIMRIDGDYRINRLSMFHGYVTLSLFKVQDHAGRI